MTPLKGTILIVDDEKGVLNLATLVLEKEGYEVLTADSGYNAYSLLEKRHQTLGEVKVHLVITDWKMKGWDGIKLISEIRMRSYKNLPIVLMSGAVTREELAQAAESRAASVLVKPLDKTVLVTKVAELMSRFYRQTA